MAGEQLESSLLEAIVGAAEKAEKNALKVVGSGDLDGILDQRHEQRKTLFGFSLYINLLSYIVLIAIFWVQAFQRIYVDQDFTLFFFGRHITYLLMIAMTSFTST